MDELRDRAIDELRDRLALLERRLNGHEMDHLRYFRLTLATVSILVAAIGLLLLSLARL